MRTNQLVPISLASVTAVSVLLHCTILYISSGVCNVSTWWNRFCFCSSGSLNQWILFSTVSKTAALLWTAQGWDSLCLWASARTANPAFIVSAVIILTEHSLIQLLPRACNQRTVVQCVWCNFVGLQHWIYSQEERAWISSRTAGTSWKNNIQSYWSAN